MVASVVFFVAREVSLPEPEPALPSITYSGSWDLLTVTFTFPEPMQSIPFSLSSDFKFRRGGSLRGSEVLSWISSTQLRSVNNDFSGSGGLTCEYVNNHNYLQTVGGYTYPAWPAQVVNPA